MVKPSFSLRAVFEAVALVCTVNMLLLFGGLGYGLLSGTLTTERARRIVAVLRGQDGADGATSVKPSVEIDPASAKASPGEPSAPPPMPAADREIMRREADRIQEELRQRMALNNSILLRVTAEREAFRQEQEAARRRQQATNERRASEGFERQVAILEGLAPRLAAEHLLGLDDLDEAAGLLIAMDTSRAQKIVTAAKRGDQKARMFEILQRIRDVEPGRSEQIGSPSPAVPGTEP